MARKSGTTSDKVDTKASGKSVKPKVVSTRKKVLAHHDVYDPDEIPTIILKSKTALYLDTWFPVEAGQNRPVRPYADTWVPTILFEKGPKKGLYLDTWIPLGDLNKSRK